MRGFGLGGMLHLENFINGYPANEEAIRQGLLKVLREEKYNLFFRALYKNYFTVEGNIYSTEFDIFTEIWDDVVYTNHDYADPGFINGGDYPGYSRGTYINKDTVVTDYGEDA